MLNNLNNEKDFVKRFFEKNDGQVKKIEGCLKRAETHNLMDVPLFTL
jgi:hypothetical protein